jgi:hypothetical protein
MNGSNSPFDSRVNLTAPVPDPGNRHALDLLGGEPLEGSGFEAELPVAAYQFDWNALNDQSQGGPQ